MSQEVKEEKKKYKYKELHTDENTYKKIKELALLTKSHMTTVVRQSVDIYYNMVKRPKTKSGMPDINKVAWYIFKFSQSVGQLKAECTEENFNHLMKNLEDLKNRLGLDVDYFEGIVKKFYEFGCNKNVSTYVDINDNAKLIITTLLERLLEKPEEKA
jgi:Fe2+ transport system protein B